MLTIFSAPAARRTFIAAGVLLGIAVLAKGLVPLVLFLPALWFLRKRMVDVAILFAAALVVAAPWYALVTLRNGRAFFDDFFWKHHFGRFLHSALQHQQPVWFYVPVLLAGLFPWTPLLALLFKRKLYADRRVMFLAAWLAWGFLFFSLSRNKLPGYLLPMLPAVAALAGLALSSSEQARYWLAACGALLSLAPPVIAVLPEALANGISHTPFHLGSVTVIEAAALAVICGGIRRPWGVAALATFVVISIAWSVYPRLDRELSGRGSSSMTCLPQTNRSQRYSLEYYAGRKLSDCK